MPSSTEASSNWDFTPVINLLRSPTYAGRSPPSRHPEAPAPSAPSTSEDADSGVSLPSLGDFGSLWSFLDSPSSSTAQPGVGVDPPLVQTEHPERSAQQPKPIQILQNPSKKTASSERSAQIEILKRPSDKPPQTPPQPIPVSGTPKSRKTASTRTTPRPQRQPTSTTAFDPAASDSNAETESDGNGAPGIFDTPLKKGALSLIPPQVGAAAAAVTEPCDTPPSSFDELDETLTPKAIKHVGSSGAIQVQPLRYKTSSERRVGLLAKLLKDFPEYAENVAHAGARPTGSVNSRPVHVFVDISNIMVGYHDSMKVSRNIPVKTRIRRLPLSFQNFSLILERGRPIAKRVLVGSDRFAAINEGEQLGYETNILDRVHKIKHTTPRQKKFRKHGRARSQDGGSSSETNDPAAQRWVEQGVDEILHLKILESLLDTDEPSTIVLATGDAAEAEFSGGFMKMVERALQRGWNVELVSFTQVTSYAYRRKEFRKRWGDQFRVVALDEYLEELLDVK